MSQSDKLVSRVVARLGLHDGSGLLLDVAGTNAEDFDRLVEQLGAPQVLEVLSGVCWDRDALLVSSVQGAGSLRRAKGQTSRVAIFYHTLGTGGAERITLDTVRTWCGMGYEVLLLCDEGQFAGVTPDDGVTLAELPDCLSPDRDVQIKRARALHEALASFGADLLVYCQWLSPTLAWDFLATKLAGASFVVFTHGTTRVLTGYENPNYLRLPSIYCHVDGVVCLSDEDVRLWSVFNGVVRRAVNKVEPCFLDAQIADLGGHLIGWVGRISYDKAPLEMLDVLRHVVDEVEDARLIVAGPFGDITRDSYQAYAEELGVWGHVELLGDVAHEELPDLLSGCDVVAFTSHMEGYLVALAEAKVLGIPCAVYNLSYLTLLEGEHGVLTAPIGDVNVLASQVIRLLTDKKLARRLGADARAHALKLQSFDMEAFWEHLFETVGECSETRYKLGAEAACMLYEMGQAEKRARLRCDSLERQLIETQDSLREANSSMEDIWNSFSLKVGRFLTAPARILRDVSARFPCR